MIGTALIALLGVAVVGTLFLDDDSERVDDGDDVRESAGGGSAIPSNLDQDNVISLSELMRPAETDQTWGGSKSAEFQDSPVHLSDTSNLPESYKNDDSRIPLGYETLEVSITDSIVNGEVVLLAEDQIDRGSDNSQSIEKDSSIITDGPLEDGTLDSASLSSVHIDSSNINVSLTSQEIEALPSALGDWAVEESVSWIGAGQTDNVIITVPIESEASLFVLAADYLETQPQSSEHEESVHEYTGLNVYYVPEGESFPTDYNWSDSGATLFNSQTHAHDEGDFGGIKLLMRIETGSWGYLSTATSEETGIIFDERLGSPNISSNINIYFP